MANPTVTGKPTGNVDAFKACVAGGGKVSVSNNGDGTVTEVCSLGGKTFKGAAKAAPKAASKTTPKGIPSPPTTTTKPNTSYPAAKKAKADMETPTEKATAGLKFTKVEMSSDGTATGTKVLLNGKAIPNLRSLSFYFYPESSSPIDLSFSTQDPAVNPGELRSYTTYSLRCPCVSPCYATAGIEQSTASVEGPSFEVKQSITDPLVRPAQVSPGRDTFANALRPR